MVIRRLLKWCKIIATDFRYFYHVAFCLLVTEICLAIFIVKFIPYTEIDWVAYMQEVEGVLNGTLDYAQLKGDTGPLVYPAGFVYIFITLYYTTNHGADVETAQWIFSAIYLVNLAVVLSIYFYLHKTEKYPPYLLLFLGCTAYRIHSIYMLRLFNDPVAMLFLYVAVLMFLHDRWMCGCVMYSLAVSIKMNVLLFSPGLLVLLLTYHGWRGSLLRIAVCALVQGVLGMPFLLNNPVTYFNGAFNFGRQFSYQWTVNWRLLPERIFLNRGFHFILLFFHLFCLSVIVVKYCRRYGGLKLLISWRVEGSPAVSKRDIALILFTSNFIGMSFSRSLHYQFYVWYFHSLPYLLWSTALHPAIRIGVLLIIEWAWNVYPSTVLSSVALHVAHAIILGALYCTKLEPATAKIGKEL